jgi:hypothetical protein
MLTPLVMRLLPDGLGWPINVYFAACVSGNIMHAQLHNFSAKFRQCTIKHTAHSDAGFITPQDASIEEFAASNVRQSRVLLGQVRRVVRWKMAWAESCY